MKSKEKPTPTELKQTSEILFKFKQFMKQGNVKGAQEYLLKTRHELRNSNN